MYSAMATSRMLQWTRARSFQKATVASQKDSSELTG